MRHGDRSTGAHLTAIMAAAHTGFLPVLRVAVGHLLNLPRRALDFLSGGSTQRTVARLKPTTDCRDRLYEEGEIDSPHPQRMLMHFQSKKQLQHIHRQLDLGNISCAAQVLEETKR
jgi:hypothetical protein